MRDNRDFALGAALGVCVGAALLEFVRRFFADGSPDLADPSSRRRKYGKNVRRIVTGHNAKGEAVVLSDALAVNFFEPPMRTGVQVNNCWKEIHLPTDRVDMSTNNDETVPGDSKVTLLPPSNGSVFRVIEFAPEHAWIDKIAR
jgi:hypothetical protein